jgi:hypothetical protein
MFCWKQKAGRKLSRRRKASILNTKEVMLKMMMMMMKSKNYYRMLNGEKDGFVDNLIFRLFTYGTNILNITASEIRQNRI